MITGAYGIVDFFIYQHGIDVAIEANTSRALDFIRRSKYEIHQDKIILLGDGACFEAFDAIDAAGYSTMAL